MSIGSSLIYGSRIMPFLIRFVLCFGVLCLGIGVWKFSPAWGVLSMLVFAFGLLLMVSNQNNKKKEDDQCEESS